MVWMGRGGRIIVIIVGKGLKYGAASQEQKRKIYGCSERGHAQGWCDRRGCSERVTLTQKICCGITKSNRTESDTKGIVVSYSVPVYRASACIYCTLSKWTAERPQLLVPSFIYTTSQKFYNF